MKQQDVAEWKASPAGRREKLVVGRTALKNEILEINEKTENGFFKLFAAGRIDSNSANCLLEKLEEALALEHKKIILNMYKVEYLSSTGIRVILKIYKQANEAGGSFNIERPSDIVKSVLGMVALKELLVTQ